VAGWFSWRSHFAAGRVIGRTRASMTPSRNRSGVACAAARACGESSGASVPPWARRCHSPGPRRLRAVTLEPRNTPGRGGLAPERRSSQSSQPFCTHPPLGRDQVWGVVRGPSQSPVPAPASGGAAHASAAMETRVRREEVAGRRDGLAPRWVPATPCHEHDGHDSPPRQPGCRRT
jgi:hypothetical protein